MPRPRASQDVLLTEPEEIQALASLTAHQIVSVMERVRSATVTELAEHVGIPAGSLYYHVRKLEAVGVLAPTEKRSTGGRMETVYAIQGREVVLDSSSRRPKVLAALARTVRTRLRAVERWYLAALHDGDTVRTGRGRNLSLHQHHARLSPRHRDELQRRIADLEAFLLEHDDPRRTDFTHVTVAVLPVPRPAAGD